MPKLADSSRKWANLSRRALMFGWPSASKRYFFLSYRRNDTAMAAGRLTRDLVERYGAESVFRDSVTIRIGADLHRTIDEALTADATVLALIGQNWNDADRLADATDWVRQELETAFERNARVIPILVDGAVMPAPTNLPDKLKRLAYLNAARLRDSDWENDVNVLRDDFAFAAGQPRAKTWARWRFALGGVSIGCLALAVYYLLVPWPSLPDVPGTPAEGQWDVTVTCPNQSTLNEYGARFHAGRYSRKFDKGTTVLALGFLSDNTVSVVGSVTFAPSDVYPVSGTARLDGAHYKGSATYGVAGNCTLIARRL